MKLLSQRNLLFVIKVILISIFSALMVGCNPPQPETPSSIPAFPSAEGYGANSAGGRGGRVIEVSNLSDTGPGSLRSALEAEGPRIVVFRVGGTIELLSSIEIEHPYITIAGQTAPGGGITIKNHPSNTRSPIRIKTHDVIMRYIRSRSGPSSRQSDILDAITIDPGFNIIIDHCSFSWATDEVFQSGRTHDMTVQWNIISEGLSNSTHPKGEHSKGLHVRDKDSDHITIHHNLLAHNFGRNADINTTGKVDFVNNVVYNAGRWWLEFKDKFGEPRVNIIGNYFKHGSDSNDDFEVYYYKNTGLRPQIYVKGNIGLYRPANNLPEYLVVREDSRQFIVDTPFPSLPINTSSAFDAYTQVLTKAGATRPMRDAVDERIVNDVINGTGKIIDSPAEVGGWPELALGTPPIDTDHDGIPDDWEDLHRLNKNNSADGPADADGDGYTNIEEYLEDLVN